MQSIKEGAGLPVYNAEIPDNCLLKLEMQDGSVQFVQIGPPNTPKVVDQSAQTDVDVVKNYTVVYPNELNLCSATSTPDTHPILRVKEKTSLPRGRPRKQDVDHNAACTPPKIEGKPSKTMRTRSGRVTRPPQYMEKEFETIVVNNKGSMDTEEVSTTQFEPIRTDQFVENGEEPKLVSLEPKSTRKRLIYGQYRCPLCKKAYLGRNRMAMHLKKHPDHEGNHNMNMEDSDTWSCLIETALKAKDGEKGLKFCREIIYLIKNARTLAKYFFKPAKDRKVEYTVESLLSSILNINEGGYRFNENELCKDVGIFSFLDYFDPTFTDHILKEPVQSESSDSTPLKVPKVDVEQEKIDEIVPEKCEAKVCDEIHCAKIDLHFGSDIMDVIEENSQSGEPKKVQTVDIYRHHEHTKESIPKNIATKNENYKKSKKLKTLKSKKDETKFDVFNTSNMFHNGDEPMIEMFPSQSKVSASNVKNNLSNSDQLINGLMDKNAKEKKSKVQDDFDLHKLHLDEFMLPDPPNNLLDTSTGSDDIMNVDQFVNERFKKLTESDEMPLPNSSLNLELPTLDCFNFNT